VQALVPVLGAAGRVLPPLLKPLVAAAEWQAGPIGEVLHRAVRLPGVWEAVKALRIVHPDLCPREAFEPYFEHLAQLDLRGWFALARDLMTHDATDLLPEVRVPALVVAGERDLFTPMKRSEEMAAKIPGAQLLVLREGSHAGLVEQPELVALTLEKFLRVHHLA
jgi:pimeloyl-ACP methyl ester carboxylesterase